MTAKTPKSSGLRYGMTGFLHARQPTGAHPSARLALKEAGHIREPDAPTAVPPPSPIDDARSVIDTAATEVIAPAPPVPPQAAHEPARPSEPASATTPRIRRRANAPRMAADPSTNYKLLPTAKTKRRPRSHHFRFPEDIDDYLHTLAETFECTRTHVVCSAIRSEWTKLRRRQTREAKKQPAAQ